MKKYILTAIWIVAAIGLSWSQKVITQKLEVSGKKVELKFDFADSIRIEAWNKNTLELNVRVNIDNNRFNDHYALKVTEQSGSAELNEKIDFDAIKKIKGNKNNGNFETEIIYTLKVPSNLEFNVKTIAGQIVLIGLQGKMTVNSISGFIDYSVPASMKARINLSTISGDVYSDVKFDNKTSKEMNCVGTKRELILNGGSLPIELKTISGNIYLRKSK